MEKLPKKNNMYIFLYFLKIDDRCLIPRRILSESGTLFYSEYGAAFIMVIRVVEFSSGGTTLERFLIKNQESFLRIGVVKSCQKLGINSVIK